MLGGVSQADGGGAGVVGGGGLAVPDAVEHAVGRAVAVHVAVQAGQATGRLLRSHRNLGGEARPVGHGG